MIVLAALLACGRTLEAEPAPAAPDPAACIAEAQALLALDATSAAALEPLQCACAGGEAMACTTLAVWHREGLHVEQDASRSAALFQAACEGGDGWACNGWALALVDGEGVARDLTKGVEVAVRGCESATLPSEKACSNAGLYYFTGRAGVQDFDRAAALFDRGCRMGDATSCKQLQVAMDPSGYATAMAPGCAAGDPQRCANLATALPPGDPARRAALSIACDAGVGPSCKLLADAP